MTIHQQHEAFALLDDAIEALFDATRDEGSDPNDVPVNAVLLLGVQRVNDNGDRIGYVEVYPRAGSQPRPTSPAGWSPQPARCSTAPWTTATTSHDRDPGGVNPHPRPTAPLMAIGSCLPLHSPQKTTERITKMTDQHDDLRGCGKRVVRRCGQASAGSAV